MPETGTGEYRGRMEGRVLVIDDEPAVLRVVRRYLERAGFETKAVQSAREGQACLESESFDVAVVDLIMPGINGLELLAWMRENVPTVVPVVLSATASVTDAIEAVQRGAFDFVAKPIDSATAFTQHVKRAVTHKRLRDRNAELLKEREAKNIELENRLSQLELAHSVLQSQALAIQVDLNRARRIQYALLPETLPFPDRVSLSVLYRPAAKVGGDLYDVFQIGDRRLGLYIADTAGHGISSAMLAVFLKLAVNPLGEMVDQDRMAQPGAVLRSLNEIIFEEAFGHDMFISMTYLVLDTETREVRCSSAGHPALLIRRSNGSVDSVRTPAPALGLNPNVCYTDSAFALQPGDVVVLYTDGVLDMCNDKGEFYGPQRLKDVVANADPHADTIVSAFDKDLREFRTQPFSGDDVTVVALGAELQRVAYDPPKVPEAPVGVETKRLTSPDVRMAREGGRLFINVLGSGTWQESQRVLDLVEEARKTPGCWIILDLGRCTHLDSTFYGVLHNLATCFEEDVTGRFEIQNVKPPLLREMSELGLTTVLMHFRSNPIPLPDSMRPIDYGRKEDAAMGRLLLWAHEALVEADPSNADRFAAVLEVLHDQVKHGTPAENPPR